MKSIITILIIGFSITAFSDSWPQDKVASDNTKQSTALAMTDAEKIIEVLQKVTKNTNADYILNPKDAENIASLICKGRDGGGEREKHMKHFSVETLPRKA
jgi:hypothetical protein